MARPTTYSPQELSELAYLYSAGFACGDGELDAYCNKWKRLKSNVCRKARELKLGTSRQRKFSAKQNERISESAKRRIKENGHPKGMLGKSHTEKERQEIGKRASEMWANPNSKVNTREHRQSLSDRASLSMNVRLEKNPTSVYSNGKRGKIAIGDKLFFARSSWEANIGAYLQFLKDNREIKDWEHEPKTFWFLKIMRGVRSYKPDFLITNNDGSQYYEEVKGWMDKKSATKLKRMKKYYPDIEVRVLDEKRYKAIALNKNLIPNWGLLDK